MTATASPVRSVRPFYWSVRRELWENRSIVVAPLVVGGLLFLGFLLSLQGLPDAVRNLQLPGGAEHTPPLALPYNIAAIALIITSVLVAAFYSLSALHGERRDRSILFWKSLPVSDLITVASKAVIPLAVLPVIAFVVVVVLQLLMVAISALVLAANGLSPGLLLAQLPTPANSLVLLWGLASQSLWLSPVWAWLLLVSGWARRAPFLWAILPPAALGVVEKMAFGTHYVSSLIGRRLSGGFEQAFGPATPESILGDHQPTIDAARFLTNPEVWLGVAVAAGLLYAAIRLRRIKEPV